MSVMFCVITEVPHSFETVKRNFQI